MRLRQHGFPSPALICRDRHRQAYESLILDASSAIGMKTAAGAGDERSINLNTSDAHLVLAVEPGRHCRDNRQYRPAGTVHCSIGDWAATRLPSCARGHRRLLSRTFRNCTAIVQAGLRLRLGMIKPEWCRKVLAHDGSNARWCPSLSSPRRHRILTATNAATELPRSVRPCPGIASRSSFPTSSKSGSQAWPTWAFKQPLAGVGCVARRSRL
jgi:hypothetical protein